jgi:hypothetical protein
MVHKATIIVGEGTGLTATSRKGIHKTYNHDLWTKVMEIGEKQEPASKGITNHFNEGDVTTIIATMDYFNASDIWKKQTYWDLMTAKYRLFDWLAMCVMGRNDDDRETNNQALKVLVHSYLKSKGDPKKFIEDLRYTDYDVDHSWEKLDIDVEEKEEKK